MLMGPDLQRIAENGSPAVGSRAQSHDLGTQRHPSIIAIVCLVVESNVAAGKPQRGLWTRRRSVRAILRAYCQLVDAFGTGQEARDFAWFQTAEFNLVDAPARARRAPGRG